MDRLLLRAILVALVATCALLAGCGDPYAGKAAQPALVNKALNNVPVVVTPHFIERSDIPRYCLSGMGACAHLSQRDGTRYADLYTVEPTDFNDFERLETVGHECWHAFGAKHVEPPR